MDSQGANFLGGLLMGLVGDFPPESDSNVVSIFRVIATTWPTQMLVWLPEVLQRMPSAVVPDQVKQKFLEEITTYVIFVSCVDFLADKILYVELSLARGLTKSDMA